MSKSSITVIFDGGQTRTCHSSDKAYTNVKNLIQERKFNEIEAALDVIARVNKEERIKMDRNTKKLLIDGENAPPALVKVLTNFIGNDEEIKPFIKFWDNLKQNSNKTSVERLYDFLLANHVPITEDGCFIAYKYVRNDFRDVHSGKFDNSPGKDVKMPREECDEDSNVTCSRGLHAAAFGYAFNGGTRVVLVKINPKDVVAVPPDYNQQKMRVCEYYVVEEYKKVEEIKTSSIKVMKAWFLTKLQGKKQLVDKKNITSKQPETWLEMVRANTIVQAIKLLQEKYNQSPKKATKKKVVKKVTKKVTKKVVKKVVKKVTKKVVKKSTPKSKKVVSPNTENV